VKHRFLLDIMVVYFAIKEVYEGEIPDQTCAQLIQLIGQNCHAIIVDMRVKERYDHHLSGLFSQPQYQTQTALFLANVVYNPRKFIIETSEAPELPPSVIEDIPPEDRYVVRAGLISRPIIVTAEERLLNGINKHREVLELTAVTPAEAVELARET
jgi:hypothetical protein